MTGWLAPGSFAWLVAHDLRLSLRRFQSMFGKLKPRTATLIVIVALIAFHALAWPVAHWFSDDAPDGGAGRLFYPAMAGGVLFILPWLISQALTGATRALYTRGDLDLLLASPLPATHILGARAIAIAFEALGAVAVLVVPFVNMNVFVNGWRWLAVYPALLAGALFATAIGIALALGLVHVVGPRRTRVLSQVLATLVGAAFVLGLQVLNMFPGETREDIVAAIERSEPGSLFNRHGLLWLPIRAAAGDLTALTTWSFIAAGLFIAICLLMARAFTTSAVLSAGVAGGRRTKDRRIRFRANRAWTLRTKEWRLIARDPWLISQLLLQVIYTLPVALIVWRTLGTRSAIAISVAPALVVIASQVAASLAWLAISSEDAPEFLASAPVTRGEIERRKLEAIALPLIAFLALPLIGLALVAPGAAFWAIVFAGCGALSTALLNLWHPMPGRRVMVMRRHSQSKLIAMMEHLLALLWAMAMVMVVLGSKLALVPVCLACLVLWLNRPARTA